MVKTMPKFVKTLLVLGALVLAAKFSWDAAYPSGTWRYKVTVTVETPEGLKTGSAVREVYAYRGIDLLPEQTGGAADITGEAAAVDLGERGKLFALLDVNEQYTVFNAFPFEGALTAEGIRYYSNLKTSEPRSLARMQYPMMVRFKDMNDPKSVELVFGKEMYTPPNSHQAVWREVDNFEKVYGKDFKVKDVTVQITDEAAVIGKIYRLLPWLAERKNKKGYLGSSDTPPFDDPSKTYLNGSEFIQGRQK